MGEPFDIESKPDGVFRIVVWSIGSVIERRYASLRRLEADVAVLPRMANEVRLLKAGLDEHNSMAWVGRHVQRGLGVMGFDLTAAKLDGGRWDQRLEWIAPVSISGEVSFAMLAVWALNEKAQVKFKSKPPASQPIQMMRLYEKMLREPCVVAGDFGTNPVFHRNDPNWDMLELVALLRTAGYVSAYHEFGELEHGDPREVPTRFRPGEDGGTERHHVDYCFVPRPWLSALRNVQIGDPDVWIPFAQAEEHVPVVCDFDAQLLAQVVAGQRKNR